MEAALTEDEVSLSCHLLVVVGVSRVQYLEKE